MLRFALALVLAASLAACSTSPMDEQASYSGYAGNGYGNGVDPRSIANATALPRAYAQLPVAAGPVVNVLEKRFTNGVIQDIILAGDVQTGGENKITVSLATRQPNSGDNSNPGMLWLTKADDHAVFQEISDQFPDVNMNLSQIVDRNAQGPFGYALGKRGSITCIYAWQWIEDRSGTNAIFFDLTASDRPAVTIRVRLCKTGVSEQVLAGFVRQMVVNTGGLGRNYYGGGTAYYQGQAPAGVDALTIAAGGGPGYAIGYRPQDGYGLQPTALAASTPAQYRAPQARRLATYRPLRTVRYYGAPRRHLHRASYQRRSRVPRQEFFYNGQTAAMPMAGQAVDAPSPAQVPRYVPAPSSRGQGLVTSGYSQVPLPE